jgi:SAM-dependent methyltransferase
MPNAEQNASADISQYLSGERLYGDDFSLEEIEAWFSDEAEAYAELGAMNRSTYNYSYHSLNYHHFFRFIRHTIFSEALGLGSAYGDEFAPISHQIKKITVLDPSQAFCIDSVNGTPIRRVAPRADGTMPFPDCSFDLITSFGVLHHIPNVTYVLKEAYRCLKPDGVLLTREPIVSMGDWRHPRRGLTKRERGIPIKVFDKTVQDIGFLVNRRSLCDFRPIAILAKKVGGVPYNSRLVTIIDSFFSQIFQAKVLYHRTRPLQKLGPASVCYMLRKPPFTDNTK